MTPAQEAALRSLCERYRVPFNPEDWRAVFDLPPGYVAGWAGPIYCGCSPEGHISS